MLPLSLPSLFLMNANNMVGVYPGLGCVLAFLLYLLLIVWSVALLAYEKLGPLAILRGSLPLLLAVTVGGAAWGSWKLPDVAAVERGGFVMPSRTRNGRAKGKSGVPSLLVRHLHSRPFLCTMSRYDVTDYFMGFHSVRPPLLGGMSVGEAMIQLAPLHWASLRICTDGFLRIIQAVSAAPTCCHFRVASGMSLCPSLSFPPVQPSHPHHVWRTHWSFAILIAC